MMLLWEQMLTVVSAVVCFSKYDLEMQKSFQGSYSMWYYSDDVLLVFVCIFNVLLKH